MVNKASQIAELGFYPFEDTRSAWNELWRNVQSRAKWLPEKLQWTDQPKELWLRDELVVSHTCGWPLVTRLSEKVRVVGAFRHTTAESASHFYRSVILGRVDGTPFDFQGSVAAINDLESLSGSISLIAAIHGPQEIWRGEIKLSGSHAESVQMLCRGEADIASIDSVSLAHLRRIMPKQISELYRICTGPIVPCLPIITSAKTTDEQLDDIRNAFSIASTDPTIKNITNTLFISGFDALDLEDYLPLRNLTPSN